MSEDQQLFQGEEGGGVAAAGILVPRSDLLADNPETDHPSVDVVEANLHLLSCLNAIAGANMRAGLETAGSRVLDQTRYDNVDAVVSGAHRKREQLQLEAKRHFAAAYGLSVMKTILPEDEAKADAREAYREFLEDKASSHKKLDTTRNKLRRSIRSLTERHAIDDLPFDIAIGQINQRIGFRPYDGQEPEITDEGDETSEDQQLGHRLRLEVLQFDPRGGFRPSTRQELNTVVAYLDYLDNPEHPLGVSAQLLEVLVHQRKPDGRTEVDGVRAVESITWEIGDYAIDATQALVAIEQLAADLEDVRPSLQLAELDAVDIDHPALPYVFQYFDTEEFIEHGRIRGLNQLPLRTRKLRLTDESGRELHHNADGKHKIMHSQYTTPNRTNAFKTHFKRRMGLLSRVKGLKVKEVREAIGIIREQQELRLTFMLQRLEDIRGGFYHEHAETSQGKGILRAIEDSEDMVAAVYAESLADQRIAA
jgi:hypothetical protein